jgi:hypothetical protein
MGMLVLPSVVAITPRGAGNARAVELAEFLLAPPQAFRIALITNAFVISADGKARPSLLNVDRMTLTAISYGELVKKLAAIRAALSGAPA